MTAWPGVWWVTHSRVNRSRPMTGTSQTAPGNRGGSMSRDGRPDPATEAFVAYRNLLFTVASEGLGCRRRGRAAGDLAAVGWCRPRHGAGPACLPGPDHYPPGAGPATHARPPQGVLRRPLAARAAADHARRGRGCRAGRQRLDSDAAGTRDPHAARTG